MSKYRIEILYIKGRREAFFITRPSIRKEDEEENEVTAADAEAVIENQRRRVAGERGGGHPAGFWGLQAGCRSDMREQELWWWWEREREQGRRKKKDRKA